ncbi:hypothetical protein E4U54_000725 [Claviceps lovelessii]|nr:hypothetical protein E4U54_000725 [Claviceps lovelessii]
MPPPLENRIQAITSPTPQHAAQAHYSARAAHRQLGQLQMRPAQHGTAFPQFWSWVPQLMQMLLGQLQKRLAQQGVPLPQ